MRQNHVISLLQTGYTTCQVSYDLRCDDMPSGVIRSYTFKTAIKDLKEGDIVVVPHDSKVFSLVRVLHVHKEPKIDLEAGFDYKWTVCKVDSSDYEKLITMEAEVSKKLKQIETEHVRAEAIAGLKGLYGDELTTLEYSIEGEKE